MNPFKQLISDGEQPSTMRVAFLILMVFVVPPFMTVWVILCLRQNQFIVPPSGFITVLSVAFGAKSIQSVAENFSPSSQNQNGERSQTAATTSEKP